MLIYGFTDVFLYENIITNKIRTYPGLCLFSEVHYALYIYHVFAQISFITLTSSKHSNFNGYKNENMLVFFFLLCFL